jgi:hypothetical protein
MGCKAKPAAQGKTQIWWGRSELCCERADGKESASVDSEILWTGWLHPGLGWILSTVSTGKCTDIRGEPKCSESSEDENAPSTNL